MRLSPAARATGRRLAQVAVLLPLLSFVVFALVHAVPGDPDALLLEADPSLSDERIEAVRALRGLDRSLPERYRCWLIGREGSGCGWWPGGQGLLRGDLGWSRAHGRPVGDLLLERLGRTLAIMGPAFALALVASLALGSWAAARRGRWPDQVVSGLGILGLAAPLHWVALLAVLAFGLGLGWLPTSGMEDPRAPGLASKVEHAVLPVAVTAAFFASRWIRHVRAAVAEVLAAPFVIALRSRGMTDRQIAGAVLRAALGPVLTVIGHSLPSLFSGSVVIERVFVYPGMGSLLLDAVYADDHLVAAVLLLGYSGVTLVAALATDLVVLAVDPRLRDPAGNGGLG